MADEPKSGTSIKILSFRSTDEPRIQEFLAVYDTRLFANRVEENRGYPPRGGVATRQVGFAFGGTPVYFIGSNRARDDISVKMVPSFSSYVDLRKDYVGLRKGGKKFETRSEDL